VLSGLKLLRQRIENNKIKAKITRALNAKEDPINKQPQSGGKF
jgi:hypothetical protein